MINSFNEYLITFTSDEGVVNRAMKYSLLSPGKRIRPLMLLSCLADLNIDYKEGFDAAVALEMVHTYSLIHDDLPAMDNDDYRRGVLTNHKMFGEGYAILAGDALLTKAFEVLSVSKYTDDIKVKLISVLAKCSGNDGMILGQELDIANNLSLTIEELENIHINKTGKLFAASLMMAGLIANRLDIQSKLKELGFLLGLAFQIQDDMLEKTSDFQEFGKLPSDSKNQKLNYLSLLTIEECIEKLETIFEKCYNLIDDISQGYHLKAIVDKIKTRRK